MTPRSFWAILIKILGIYILIESVTSIPQFLGTVYLYSTQSNGVNSVMELTALSILFIIIYLLILRSIFFKTDWIIDKLKLDQGFENERFEFNMHRSIILKIAIMVIGGLLVINNFPPLCEYTFNCFRKSDTFGGFDKNPETRYVILYFIRTLAGYFMLTCSRLLVNFFELKTKGSKPNRIQESE